MILYLFHFRNTAAHLSLFVPNRLIFSSSIFCQSLYVYDVCLIFSLFCTIHPRYFGTLGIIPSSQLGCGIVPVLLHDTLRICCAFIPGFHSITDHFYACAWSPFSSFFPVCIASLCEALTSKSPDIYLSPKNYLGGWYRCWILHRRSVSQ